jgi:alkylhydroperoxidase family enzyme
VTATQARVAPLPVEEWGDDVVAALSNSFGRETADRFLAAGTDAVPNVLGTLLRHPGLAGPFLAYNNVLLFTPTLPPRLRELMVLRVAWRTRSIYEWVQHVRLALSCDVTREEIDAIARGAETETWAPIEADLLAATDQLVDGYRIDDTTWARLAGHFDERQLVELLFVVGTYTALAMVFNSLGLELDDELDSVDAPPIPGTEDR